MKQPDTKTVNRVVLSSLIGATIEWYDFFLYGVMAGIVLNKLFFPADDPTTSLLLTYATFAVGFLTRPIGGIVFGHFGDRIGEKTQRNRFHLLAGRKHKRSGGQQVIQTGRCSSSGADVDGYG